MLPESLLQLRYDRTAHAIMRIAPETLGASVAFPVIGNPDASDESDLSINHQYFSMSAKVDPREMHEAKNLHADAGPFH